MPSSSCTVVRASAAGAAERSQVTGRTAGGAPRGQATGRLAAGGTAGGGAGCGPGQLSGPELGQLWPTASLC